MTWPRPAGSCASCPRSPCTTGPAKPAIRTAAAGWELCYLPALTVHHQASTARDPHKRRADGIRNTLWTTWLRRPLGPALRRTVHLLRTVPRDRVTARGLLAAARGLPWVLRERRVLPPHAEARFAALEHAQRSSTARRYVS